MAGHEPTTNLLSNGLRQVLAHREVWHALCQHPAYIPNTVEELLRFDTSAVAWHRRTRRPVDMGGVSLPAGARLLLLLGSANHDEAHFPDPERLDIHRANAKEHLSFGFGIHYCLGAPLARLEMLIALELLTTRLPGMRLVEGQSLAFLPNTTVRGPQQLWVEWEVA
jgi:cytochrome P450